MTTKKLILSLPEKMHEQLKKDMKDYSYTSIQEIILEIIREKYFKRLKEKDTRGRPEKFDAIKFLSSKKPMFK